MKNILLIWWHELCAVFRDKGVLLFVIVVPLGYPLLYAFIYNNERVTDVPVAVVDLSQSSTSRDFKRMLDATPDVAIAAEVGSVAEAEELNKRGEVYGVVVIPEDLTRQLSLGRQATIGVYADMAGMLYYKALLLAATNVSLEMNKQIKVERFYTGATDRQEAIATQPIAYDYVALYNPQSGFAAFLMPPVLMLILQQTLMLGIGMTGGANREHYGGRALPTLPYYRRPLQILAGKTLVYLLIYLIMAAYMFLVVSRIFTLPQLGRFSTYMLFILPYLLACIFMAITFSAFIYRREDCILMFVFMSLPLLFISGISWPGAAVPPFWKWVSYLFPSTFATNGYVRINTMGATLHEVSREYTALWLQAGFYLLTSLTFLRLATRRQPR